MTSTRRLPLPHTESYAWRRYASCRQMDSDLFFGPPDESNPARPRREDHAKAICADCPVCTACRHHALVAAEPYGVWGGLAPQERHSHGSTGGVAPPAGGLAPT